MLITNYKYFPLCKEVVQNMQNFFNINILCLDIIENQQKYMLITVNDETLSEQGIKRVTQVIIKSIGDRIYKRYKLDKLYKLEVPRNVS